MTTFTLEALADIVAERAAASPEASYTAKLLSQAPVWPAKKFGEEAVEAVIAAISNDRNGLVNESADVLYHLLVILQAAHIPLSEVMGELQRRTAQSGLAEKAARHVS